MKFRIRFFCNFLQSSDVISIRLDDQEDFLVSDLSDVVYKDYEIEFKSANVGKSHIHFLTLVRPICIEAHCCKRLLLSPPQYLWNPSKHLLSGSKVHWQKTKIVVTSSVVLNCWMTIQNGEPSIKFPSFSKSRLVSGNYYLLGRRY